MTTQTQTSPVRMEASGPVLVAFEGVSKRFGPTLALNNVTLVGRSGSVHAITGENGAGKSTLMNLLAGVHQPDSGAIALRGTKVSLDSTSAARSAGVSTIFQELTLMPNLTVAENLSLGREPRHRGIVDRAAMRARAKAALDRLDSSISPDTYCDTLTVGEQQMVEIAKGIAADADVFILDEPTAALNAPEVEKLAVLIDALRAEGKLIFYISHRLEEIFRFCDEVSVMKDGALVSTQGVESIDRSGLITAMVGRELGDLFPHRNADAKEKVALRVAGLKTMRFDADVSFELNRGEILGLAGLDGQGQRDIVRAISGLERPAAGRVSRIDAKGSESALGGTIVAVTRAGVGFVPEDRKSEGLYLSLSIGRNIGLGVLRTRGLASAGHVRRDVVADQMQAMRVAASTPQQPVGSLSGGNQQKVMLGRWLASGVDILLIEEPTRGVDVGAKAEIYALLRAFADEGGAVLLTSSELMEVLGLCDRILTVREGAVVGEHIGAQATEEDIMHAALTGKPLGQGRQ